MLHPFLDTHPTAVSRLKPGPKCSVHGGQTPAVPFGSCSGIMRDRFVLLWIEGEHQPSGQEAAIDVECMSRYVGRIV